MSARPGRSRRGGRIAVPIALVLLATGAATPVAWARPPAGSLAVDPALGTTPGIDPLEGTDADAGRPIGRGVTPVVAPIPFKNTQVGWGLALVVGAIHRFDPDTTLKPSTGVVGGFYTENGSWGLVAMELARLSHDTWRLRGLVSHAEVHYDFYGIGEEAGNAGISVPIDQTMDFGVASVLRRVGRGVYAGAAILGMRTTAELRNAPSGSEPSNADLARTDLFAPGLQVEYDTRDDDYWPTAGSLARLKSWFFSDALGGSRSFQRYMGTWSWYTRLPDERIVLATNVNVSAAAGDAPFYALPSVGAGTFALRGYTQGRYRDNVMTTAQAEMRFHSAGRIGATAFGGFGQVAPSVGDLGRAEVLPAGGLGLRYRLTQNFPMHMRFDYAWGKNGNQFYFSVAEAF